MLDVALVVLNRLSLLSLVQGLGHGRISFLHAPHENISVLVFAVQGLCWEDEVLRKGGMETVGQVVWGVRSSSNWSIVNRDLYRDQRVNLRFFLLVGSPQPA